MRIISVLFMICLSGCFLTEKSNGPAADENTLFLAHFENESKAEFAKGSPQMEKYGSIKQTEGKFGKALTGFNNSQNYVEISTKNNFDPAKGTVDMWVRPDFDSDKAPERFCFFFYFDADEKNVAYKNCAYLVYDKTSQAFVFCWRAGGKAAFAQSQLQTFKRGDWVHLTCFWGGEANIITIMVDDETGISTAEIPGRWENKPHSLLLGKGKTFQNGGERSAHSDIDEFRIRNDFTQKIYDADKSVEVDGKKYFYCPRNKKADPQLSHEPKEDTGFLVFRRDPRMVYPDSIPQKEELINKVNVSTTPGELKSFYFSLYGLRDVENIKVHASIFDEAGQPARMQKGIQIKKAQFWPQKTDYTTNTYYVIPELLEDFKTANIQKNKCATFWFNFKTYENLKQGKYKGLISIESGTNVKSINIPFELDVLPFRLIAPDDKYWIMYIDTYPEKNFEQQKEMLELLKSYGISSLILNLTKKTDFKLGVKNGIITDFDSDYLRNILKIYNTIGMKGPVVLWFHSRLEKTVAEALNVKDPIYSAAWKTKVEVGLRQAVPLIDAFIKRHFPQIKWYYYGHDEPAPRSEVFQQVLWIYKILHDMKINTCLTYYTSYQDSDEIKKMIPLLTANIDGTVDGCFLQQKALKLLEKYKCPLWFIGGGCYSRQEGGLMPNRFLSGFGFYQTKGETHLSWLWHRIKNDPFNEFCKTNVVYAQNKNGMIAYPSKTNPGQYISTLQWEGIREGIIDYKYLATLKYYIELAQKNNLQKESGNARKRMDEIMSEIPSVCLDDKNGFRLGDYYLKPGNFTDGMADGCRTAIADEITKLVQALNKK